VEEIPLIKQKKRGEKKEWKEKKCSMKRVEQAGAIKRKRKGNGKRTFPLQEGCTAEIEGCK